MVFTFVSLFEIDSHRQMSKEAGYLNSDLRLPRLLEHLPLGNAAMGMRALIWRGS